MPPISAERRLQELERSAQRRGVDDLEGRARDAAERVQLVVRPARVGAPETYQLEPLSATIIPYSFSAWSTIRAWRGKPAMW